MPPLVRSENYRSGAVQSAILTDEPAFRAWIGALLEPDRLNLQRCMVNLRIWPSMATGWVEYVVELHYDPTRTPDPRSRPAPGSTTQPTGENPS